MELARKAREAYLAENPQAGTLLVADPSGLTARIWRMALNTVAIIIVALRAFQAFHRPRVEALLDAGADLLACETLPNFPRLRRWPSC